MILTKEIFEQGKSKQGGWSMAQLACFGIERLKKGWQKRLIGQEFSEEAIKNFLELKDKHIKYPETYEPKEKEIYKVTSILRSDCFDNTFGVYAFEYKGGKVTSENDHIVFYTEKIKETTTLIPLKYLEHIEISKGILLAERGFEEDEVL